MKAIGTLFFTAALASMMASAQLDVGGSRLHPATQATRQIFFQDVYRLTLALPQGADSLARATAPDVPKALVVDVLYDGSVPEDVPSSWRDELLPALPEQDETALRRAYADLDNGDQVTVTYAPGQGTRIYVNDRQILMDPAYNLMGAFLDLWLGRTPVSEDLRQSLISDLEGTG